MDDRRRVCDSTVNDRQRDALGRVGINRLDARVAMQRRRNTEGIPGAIGPVGSALGVNFEAGGYRRKWIGHSYGCRYRIQK